MSKRNNDVPLYEICIMCGETINVLTDMPIECRPNYIHGCGQLCERCAGVLSRGDNQKK